MFPFAFVFTSLITHICCSVIEDDVGYLDQEPGHHDKAAPALKTLRRLSSPKIEDIRPPGCS